MKTAKFFIVIVMLTLMAHMINAQNTCKVLHPKIADSYTGSCKNGMADGPGEAIGTDQYKGEFRKGLPDGTGTYIWHTGERYEGSWKKGLRDGEGSYTFKSNGKDTVLTGIWKEDKYMGEKAVPPYLIQYKISVTRVSCVKMSDFPFNVVYKFSRPGGAFEDITNLLMQGSSGNETVSSNFMGFEQVTFPFTGKIRFDAPNALHTANLSYELRYTINQPGSWVVTIFY